MLHTIALAVVVVQLANVVNVPASLVQPAQMEVTRLYREIGVDVQWTAGDDEPRGDRLKVRVVLLAYESGALHHRAMTVMGAAVRTAEDTPVAYVFYRRVEAEAARYSVAPAAVLACAIAHELGHLLLPDGTNGGHSRTGLMRAAWDRHDFDRSQQGLLRFSADQAARIRRSLMVEDSVTYAR
jgi:hypothetical protein